MLYRIKWLSILLSHFYLFILLNFGFSQTECSEISLPPPSVSEDEFKKLLPSTYRQYYYHGYTAPNSVNNPELHLESRNALAQNINSTIKGTLQINVIEKFELKQSSFNKRILKNTELTFMAEMGGGVVQIIVKTNDNKYIAHAFMCKEWLKSMNQGEMKKIIDKLDDYNDYLDRRKYSKAFENIVYARLKSAQLINFTDNVTDLRDIAKAADEFLNEFLDNITFTIDEPDSLSFIYNQNYDDNLKVECFIYNENLANFDVVAVVESGGYLEGSNWIGNRLNERTDQRGTIKLNPFTIKSETDPIINVFPSIKHLRSNPIFQKIDKSLMKVLQEIIEGKKYGKGIEFDVNDNLSIKNIDVETIVKINEDFEKKIKENIEIEIKRTTNYTKGNRGLQLIIELDQLNSDTSIIKTTLRFENVPKNVKASFDLPNHSSSVVITKELKNGLFKLYDLYKENLSQVRIGYNIGKNTILKWSNEIEDGRIKWNGNNRGDFYIPKGNVTIQYILNKNSLSQPIFKDTSFVAYKDIELSPSKPVIFQSQKIQYPYNFQNYIYEGAEVKWDGEIIENYKQTGYFHGDNYKKHVLTVKKNGYRVLIANGENAGLDNKLAYKPNYRLQSIYPNTALITMERIKQNTGNYFKYLSVPGIGQYSLYQESTLRKFAAGIIFSATVGLLTNQFNYWNEIDYYQNEEERCSNTYTSLPHGTLQSEFDEFSECIYTSNQKRGEYIKKYNNNLNFIGGIYLINALDIIFSFNIILR